MSWFAPGHHGDWLKGGVGGSDEHLSAASCVLWVQPLLRGSNAGLKCLQLGEPLRIECFVADWNHHSRRQSYAVLRCQGAVWELTQRLSSLVNADNWASELFV